MVTKAEIAEVFEGMTALLEKKGDLIFKIRAYKLTAESIKQTPFQLQEHIAQGGSLRDAGRIGVPGGEDRVQDSRSSPGLGSGPAEAPGGAASATRLQRRWGVRAMLILPAGFWTPRPPHPR